LISAAEKTGITKSEMDQLISMINQFGFLVIV
jgi:hypothetical protein